MTVEQEQKDFEIRQEKFNDAMHALFKTYEVFLTARLSYGIDGAKPYLALINTKPREKENEPIVGGSADSSTEGATTGSQDNTSGNQ